MSYVHSSLDSPSNGGHLSEQQLRFDKTNDSLTKIEAQLQRILISTARLNDRLIPEGVAFPKNLKALDDIANLDDQNLTERYFAWTPQQTYALFGLPDSVYTGGTNVDWIYRMERRDLLFNDSVLTHVKWKYRD